MPNLTDIYFKNADAFDRGCNLIINEGGEGSSKTFSILQNIYDILKHSTRPLIASVCSYALPHLKTGAIRDFQKILMAYGETPDVIHNRSDHFFRIGDSILEYFGIKDNYAKVEGPRRDILFINEIINRVTYHDFDMLNQRTNLCTWIDYNPKSEFWVHDRVIPHFEHEFIHSTFRDNPWLPEAELQKILWKAGKPQFKNWWRVYGEGKIGILEDQIFENWDYYKPDLYGGVTFDEHIRQYARGYGLDFGFHPDPDAMVKTAIDEKRKIIYLDEKMYMAGQSTNDLKAACLARVDKVTDLIVAESANPRTIEDLKKNGATVKTMGLNVVPVSKTGTLEEWLKELQDYKLVITEGSHNLAKELQNYVWNDQKAGIPINAFNHLIDAFRYYFMYQKQKVNTNVWA